MYQLFEFCVFNYEEFHCYKICITNYSKYVCLQVIKTRFPVLGFVNVLLIQLFE